MKIHLQRYGTALATVLVVYGLYALLVVPRIEPSLEVRAASAGTSNISDATTTVMKRHRQKVEHLFPPGSWQLQNPKVLETEHGTLVFKDYKPLADGRMELKPLTVIVYGSTSSGKSPQRPLIMDAPEGAILQFDSDTDPARADFGRLTGGLLTGPIRIYSPPTTPVANDALEILTRNVQLDERRIWTPHAVKFTYGPSHGAGRDLVITLVPTENHGKRGNGPAIEGIKTLELVHVDKFHFETSSDVPLPGAPKPKTQPAANKPPPAPVEITCQGPFLYDFEEQVASFEDAVDVIRLNRDGPSDQLNCQLLSIYMRQKASAKEATANAPEKSPSKLSAALEVDRLVAVGHPVVLRAPSMGATARGERLEYHLLSQRIVLVDSDRVLLMDERFDIEAKQLEYALAPSGGLGRLWAAGPGRLRVRKLDGATGKSPIAGMRVRPPIAPIASRGDNSAPLMFEALWQKELRLQPHKHQHVVSLIEKASVRVAAMGGFTADEIHLWLNETPKAPSATPRAASAKPEIGSGKFEIQPDRMLALGQVKIAAQQLDGETGRLEAWFRPADPIATPAALASTVTAPAAQPSASNPGSAVAANPVPRASTNPATARNDAKPPPSQKFRLWGDVVRLQLLRMPETTTLEDVSVEGHVKLVEQLPAGAEPVLPLVITGHALQMQGGMGDSAVVHVLGEPAEVAARGTTMRGSNIHLHRGDNHAWIEGAGEMLLPLARDPSGAKLARPTNIAVTWQDGLDFDGALAHFAGNVEARSEQHQWARADTLDVTLTERIDFMKTKGAAQPQVAVVEFSGHFALENPSYDKQGKLASIEKMQAQSLRIEQQSGDIKATGPGWVSTVRLGGAENPLALGGKSTAPRPAPKTTNDPKFTYLFVEFQLQMVGNIYQRQVEFQRHVRSVYGPVNDWKGTLDIDRPELLGEQGVMMSCQRLALREMPGSSADTTSLEMEAHGDTVVEGRGFTARAARIGYADEKQLLVLEGDGRRDAELTRQTVVGGPQSHLAAQKLMYWRFDNRVDVDGVRGLEFNPTVGDRQALPK